MISRFEIINMKKEAGLLSSFKVPLLNIFKRLFMGKNTINSIEKSIESSELSQDLKNVLKNIVGKNRNTIFTSVTNPNQDLESIMKDATSLKIPFWNDLWKKISNQPDVISNLQNTKVDNLINASGNKASLFDIITGKSLTESGVNDLMEIVREKRKILLKQKNEVGTGTFNYTDLNNNTKSLNLNNIQSEINILDNIVRDPYSYLNQNTLYTRGRIDLNKIEQSLNEILSPYGKKVNTQNIIDIIKPLLIAGVAGTVLSKGYSAFNDFQNTIIAPSSKESLNENTYTKTLVCPFCNGQTNGCNKCNGTGKIQKDTFQDEMFQNNDGKNNNQGQSEQLNKTLDKYNTNASEETNINFKNQPPPTYLKLSQSTKKIFSQEQQITRQSPDDVFARIAEGLPDFNTALLNIKNLIGQKNEIGLVQYTQQIQNALNQVNDQLKG